MLALHAFNYNFYRKHQFLRMTPAQAAQVDLKHWSFADISTMADAYFATVQEQSFEAAFAAMGDNWQKQAA